MRRFLSLLMGSIGAFTTGCDLPDVPILLTDAGAEAPPDSNDGPAPDDVSTTDNSADSADASRETRIDVPDSSGTVDGADGIDVRSFVDSSEAEAGAELDVRDAAPEASPDRGSDAMRDAGDAPCSSPPATLAMGTGHTCVLLSADQLSCWGDNQQGQLGIGSSGFNQPTPTRLNLSFTVKTMASGGSHTCVATTSGGVRCWGLNVFGELGFSSQEMQMQPAPGATDVLTGVETLAAGTNHTCALMTAAGGVRCWGVNLAGESGIGSVSESVLPPATNILTGVAALAAGYSHTCAVMAANGGLRCWGENLYGQLGILSDAEILPPVLAPPTIDVLTGVKAVAAGYGHTCALMASNGGVRCWGLNGNGQLGDGTTNDRRTPPSVDVLTGVKAIAAGYAFTCALTEAGAVRCWGDNYSGELGDGATSMQRLTPGPNVPLPGPALSIAAGDEHVCVVVNDGLQCWGFNSSGQLGDTTTANNRPSPVNVAGIELGCR